MYVNNINININTYYIYVIIINSKSLVGQSRPPQPVFQWLLQCSTGPVAVSHVEDPPSHHLGSLSPHSPGLHRARGRQLSLLSIFSFPNSECVSDSVEGTRGECYTAAECYARGGTSQSTCASGIGVCCYVVQESCQTDNEVIYNNTYIRSVNMNQPDQ